MGAAWRSYWHCPWHLNLLATSSDGVHWVKPSLGIVSVGGSTANNVLMSHGEGEGNAGVWRDVADVNVSRRWKAFGLRSGALASDVGVMWSADGVHGWGREGAGVQGMLGPGQSGLDTFNNMVFDAAANQWVHGHFVPQYPPHPPQPLFHSHMSVYMRQSRFTCVFLHTYTVNY